MRIGCFNAMFRNVQLIVIIGTFSYTIVKKFALKFYLIFQGNYSIPTIIQKLSKIKNGTHY